VTASNTATDDVTN